jgi:hypothetical protein
MDLPRANIERVTNKDILTHVTARTQLTQLFYGIFVGAYCVVEL